MDAIKLRNDGWLKEVNLQRVLAVLNRDGEEARVNGGAVRNAVLGEPISDIDLSTTFEPGMAMARLVDAGIKVIPTGIEHGTITAVVDHRHFEITTLREDVETTGRHAVVRFGRSWEHDALRRDLTMNALYCDGEGMVFDPLGGYEDLLARRVRFIGDAEQRIHEDYLRILRFFRFFAWYGDARPDGEGLKACTRLKDNIGKLSVERVWAELKKLLSAPDPSRALLWMRTTGVLSEALPESEKWGIDLMHGLIAVERELGWQADPMLRLMAILPSSVPMAETLAERLRFSGREKQRLFQWAESNVPDASATLPDFDKQLYRGFPAGISDALRLELVRQRTAQGGNAGDRSGRIVELLEHAEGWQRPVFPVLGRDLIARGAAAGPELGDRLTELEQQWIDSGFTLTGEELLAL